MMHFLPTHNFGPDFHLDHTVFNQIVLEHLVFGQMDWHSPGGPSNRYTAPHLTPESLIYLESTSNSLDKLCPSQPHLYRQLLAGKAACQPGSWHNHEVGNTRAQEDYN